MKTHLSDYEQGVFDFIEKNISSGDVLRVDKWSKPETRNDFISAIKKRIDLYGDCEFNSDYTKFRKIGTWNELTDKWNTSDSKLYNEK